MNLNEKIVHLVLKKNKLFFLHKNRAYSMAPSQIAELNMPPFCKGADKVLIEIKNKKNIKSDQIKMIYDTSWFFGCDIELDLSQDSKKEGCIYSINDSPDKVWVCSYLNLVFENAPSKIYIKIEE